VRREKREMEGNMTSGAKGLRCGMREKGGGKGTAGAREDTERRKEVESMMAENMHIDSPSHFAALTIPPSISSPEKRSVLTAATHLLPPDVSECAADVHTHGVLERI
jgi:hypothetical protein